MTGENFLKLFLVFYLAHVVWETLLALLNRQRLLQSSNEVPEYFREKIDLATYKKSIAYNLEKENFSLFTDWIFVAFTLCVIFLGYFETYDLFLQKIYPHPQDLSFAALYCWGLGIILLLIKIPFSLYENFVIEKKFGFNRMSLKTFGVDLLKTITLSTLLGVPILFLVFWIYLKMGAQWWLFAFLAVFLFELLVAAIYPTFLAPLFNKFTPLPDGELKEAILKIAQQIHFKLSGIFTIDGSKRSAHSNAYFAGIGKFRRIVLFDTLVQQMNTPELVAVLAHEMGHNKMRHILKQLILGFVTGLIGFWILAQAIAWAPLYDAFRVGSPAYYKGFMLFALFAGHFTFFLSPFSSMLSRKYEYEADAFSVKATRSPQDMIQALLKLTKENLSQLNPHPLYSFYYYTHPTTLERIRAIEKQN